MNEFTIIERFFKQPQPQPFPKEILLGIGDDAALITSPAQMQYAITTDTLVAGHHFHHDAAAFDIGYKSLAVNLSDLAAMGAKPSWFTLALTLPTADELWLEAFQQGLMKLAQQFNCTLIGGDTTQGPLCITITAAGLLPANRACLRSAAQVDDCILVTGQLGIAAFGLALSEQSNVSALVDDEFTQACFTRLHRPLPRNEFAQKIRDLVSSMIDISDGFLQDLGHILEASQCGALLDVEKLPIPKELTERIGRSQALELALSGGDDYELCFTLPKSAVDIVLTIARECGISCQVIGTITQNHRLLLQEKDKKIYNSVKFVNKSGYQHF